MGRGATISAFNEIAFITDHARHWVAPDELILNGDGALWRLDLARGILTEVTLPGLPFLNNDHMPARDGNTMFVSGLDWHIHRVLLATGARAQVTRDDPARPLLHFLHGVSPDGGELAFVGIAPRGDDPWGPANIYTMPSGGGPIRQLTFDERVNWFPHIAPVGDLACYLSYPPGTVGHPADMPVKLWLVRAGRWRDAEPVACLRGGQGTINVNSWSPDGRRFAFVTYPMDKGNAADIG